MKEADEKKRGTVKIKRNGEQKSLGAQNDFDFCSISVLISLSRVHVEAASILVLMVFSSASSQIALIKPSIQYFAGGVDSRS